ncbi:MAG: hypothetical protein RR420_01050 [Anaerovoracaceae bacterium]
MKIVRGLKMLELSDIIDKCGRVSFCDTLLKREKNKELFYLADKEYMTLDTSMDGSLPVHNLLGWAKMVFIPARIVEEKEIAATKKKAVKEALSMVVSERKEDLEKELEAIEREYEEKTQSFTGEQMLDKPCYMFLYTDNKDGVEYLYDIFISVPSRIIELLTKNSIYVCERCGKPHIADPQYMEMHIPNMKYIETENKVLYFCTECEHNSEIKHVGD